MCTFKLFEERGAYMFYTVIASIAVIVFDSNCVSHSNCPQSGFVRLAVGSLRDLST